MTTNAHPPMTLRQVRLSAADDAVLQQAADRLGMKHTDAQRWILRYLVTPWLEGRVEADRP